MRAALKRAARIDSNRPDNDLAIVMQSSRQSPRRPGNSGYPACHQLFHRRLAQPRRTLLTQTASLRIRLLLADHASEAGLTAHVPWPRISQACISRAESRKCTRRQSLRAKQSNFVACTFEKFSCLAVDHKKRDQVDQRKKHRQQDEEAGTI